MRISRATGVLAGAVVCVVAAAVAPGDAQAQSDEAKKKAKEHFERGTTHYNLGRFDEAIVEFSKGFEVLPDPVFLYNIAQSHRMKGEWDRAKFFYKRYLSLAPSAPNKGDVEKRIEEMDAEIAKAKAGGGGGGGGGGGTPPGGGGGGTPPGGGGGGGGGGDTPPGGGGGGGGGGGETPPGGGGGDTPVGGGGGGTPPGGGTSIGGGAGGGDTPGIATTFRRDKPIWVTAVAGPAFVVLGGDAAPEVPTQLAITVGGGYLFTKGKLGLGAGALFGYTPIPFEPIDDTGEAGTASLTTFAVVGELFYAVGKKLDLQLELGAGTTWFGGLTAANPFTEEGVAATGPVPIFAFRLGVGVSYHITPGLAFTFVPFAFTRSSAPENADPDIDFIQKVDVLLGVAYSL